MTAIYNSSKGPVEISTMPLRYAQNALGKPQREREDDSRDAEIEALSAHVAKLQEEYAEQQATGGDTQSAGAFGDLQGVAL